MVQLFEFVVKLGQHLRKVQHSMIARRDKALQLKQGRWALIPRPSPRHASQRRVFSHAQGHARLAGPGIQSGPGCWTTFLTCPNSVDAPHVSAAQLMG